MIGSGKSQHSKGHSGSYRNAKIILKLRRAAYFGSPNFRSRPLHINDLEVTWMLLKERILLLVLTWVVSWLAKVLLPFWLIACQSNHKTLPWYIDFLYVIRWTNYYSRVVGYARSCVPTGTLWINLAGLADFDLGFALASGRRRHRMEGIFGVSFVFPPANISFLFKSFPSNPFQKLSLHPYW